MSMITKKMSIDLYQKDNDGPWCNIIVSDYHTLIGMYECGKIERQLFNMNKEQLIQLRDTLDLICNKIKDNG